jgi:uronate dehydrogenase
MTRPPPSTIPFDRLLLTGAAGGLGRELRVRLKGCCKLLRQHGRRV